MNWQKKLLPHGIAIVVLLVLSVLFFLPTFSGKILSQGDIVQYKGGAKEILDYQKTTGEDALWTNSMFGGMPSYQIQATRTQNLLSNFDSVLKLGMPRPGSYIFVALLGVYLLLIALGTSPWVAVAGAIAFGFSTYNFLIAEAGHNTKLLAMAYMGSTLAGLVWIYSKQKKLLGTALFAVFLSLNLYANHLQITYYMFFIIGLFVIANFVHSLKSATLPAFAKSTALLVFATILGVATNTNRLWTTYEYGKETMRGGSELSTGNKSGLDKDYAFAWSYGKLETFTLLVPRFIGGASSEKLGEDSELYRDLKSKGAKLKNEPIPAPTYWGAQPFTGGPIYHGAVVCFLFLLGAILLRNYLKWWLVAATLLSILLSWGKNFDAFTSLFFNFFPMYNKFRVVAMILVVAQLTMPVLGALALNYIINNATTQKKQILDALKISTLVLGILLLFFALLGGSLFSFEGANDAQYAEKGFDTAALIADRISMMRGDSIKALLFILATAGVIWAYLNQKIKAAIVAPIVALLIFIDLAVVNSRYLTSENFATAKNIDNTFAPTKADEAILQDKALDYRVLNIAKNTFNDATTSYYHKSLGGYHGAKLQRYQDVIEQYLQNSIQGIIGTLQSKPTAESINATLAQQNALNMLNTKYVIYNPDAPPIANPSAFGNAWVVANTQVVANPDEELKAIGTANLKQTAVIDQRYKGLVEGKNFAPDTTATIQLTEYSPNKLTYKATTATPQLAVFSEIYYNSGKGWQAYLDGSPTEHLRANYLLRALPLPAGTHTIEFKMEPKSFSTGNTISLIASLLALILLGVALFLQFAKKNNDNSTPQTLNA